MLNVLRLTTSVLKKFQLADIAKLFMITSSTSTSYNSIKKTTAEAPTTTTTSESESSSLSQSSQTDFKNCFTSVLPALVVAERIQRQQQQQQQQQNHKIQNSIDNFEGNNKNTTSSTLKTSSSSSSSSTATQAAPQVIATLYQQQKQQTTCSYSDYSAYVYNSADADDCSSGIVINNCEKFISNKSVDNNSNSGSSIKNFLLQKDCSCSCSSSSSNKLSLEKLKYTITDTDTVIMSSGAATIQQEEQEQQKQLNGDLKITTNNCIGTKSEKEGLFSSSSSTEKSAMSLSSASASVAMSSSSSSSCVKSSSSSSSEKPCFTSSLADILKFLELVGSLKHIKRTGWVLRDVKDCESISGHMYRMSMMTFLLDGTEGLNRTKCMELALVHDLAESLVGDITPFCGISKEEKKLRELNAMEDICKLIEPRGKRIYELFMEYEENETPESKFVKDLDRLDMVLQAFEYEKRDDCILKHQEFFDSTNGKFSHPFVVKLVNEIYEQRHQLAKYHKEQKENNVDTAAAAVTSTVATATANGSVLSSSTPTSTSDTAINCSGGCNVDENVVKKKISSS